MYIHKYVYIHIYCIKYRLEFVFSRGNYYYCYIEMRMSINYNCEWVLFVRLVC